MPGLLKWSENHISPIEGRKITVEEIAADLITGMAEHDDGYRLARWLDDHKGWAANRTLVSLLSHIPFLRNEIYDQRVRRWVKDNQVHPDLSVGDVVKVRDKEGLEHTGQIRCINYEEARYQVFVESLGHTQHGAGVQALGVPYELVEQV
jgi:hypothetical protein